MLLPVLVLTAAFVSALLFYVLSSTPISQRIIKDDVLRKGVAELWDAAKEKHMSGNNKEFVTFNRVVAFLCVFLMATIATACFDADILMFNIGWSSWTADDNILLMVTYVGLGLLTLVAMAVVALCVLVMVAFAIIEAALASRKRVSSACFESSSRTA